MARMAEQGQAGHAVMYGLASDLSTIILNLMWVWSMFCDSASYTFRSMWEGEYLPPTPFPLPWPLATGSPYRKCLARPIKICLLWGGSKVALNQIGHPSNLCCSQCLLDELPLPQSNSVSHFTYSRNVSLLIWCSRFTRISC